MCSKVPRLIYLKPWEFFSQIEPYKRILCAVLNKKYVSLATSNHYLSLAEPLGNIKISERSFPNQCFAQVMKDQKKEIWGTIICQENDCDLSQLEEEFVQSYQQLYDKDDKIYLTKYAPQNGLQISPRLQDNEDFVTHKGTVYLQSYLDELGPLNTFG
eukprot:TRINITY_DN30864_c0_g1_i3.p2 TRINITY_DN30864_c0_g1~~TRINITY_DN30864_c0_g1_i3.p2  ORF type:complete len:158 (+),score=5.63 TRINITY_DN30864_c0_g1_i3:199-672(+)